MKYKNITKRIFASILFMGSIFSSAFSIQKDSLNVLSNDTLYLYTNRFINNDKIIYNEYSDLELVEPEFYFKGYLVIKIDSVSYYKKESNKTNNITSLQTDIFWVNNLNEVEYDSCRFYFYPYFSFINRDGVAKYNKGSRDDLSIFSFYWDYYNRFNNFFCKQNVSFLYFLKDNLNTDTLINKVIFNKDNPNIKYIFFETRFNSAIIKFKNNNKNILVPTSVLVYFKPIDEFSYIKYSHNSSEGIITNFGFKRDHPILKIILDK